MNNESSKMMDENGRLKSYCVKCDIWHSDRIHDPHGRELDVLLERTERMEKFLSRIASALEKPLEWKEGEVWKHLKKKESDI
jgi:hypothetical protein